MKQRTEKRIIPDKNRYWKVEILDKTYDFRFPNYQEANEIFSFINEYKTNKSSETMAVNDLINMLPAMGIVIGKCWFNKDLDLEPKANTESFEDFGKRVCDELQEEDLEFIEILFLFNSCTNELSKRSAISSLASEKANFMLPQEGAVS